MSRHEAPHGNTTTSTLYAFPAKRAIMPPTVPQLGHITSARSHISLYRRQTRSHFQTGTSHRLPSSRAETNVPHSNKKTILKSESRGTRGCRVFRYTTNTSAKLRFSRHFQNKKQRRETSGGFTGASRETKGRGV